MRKATSSLAAGVVLAVLVASLGPVGAAVAQVAPCTPDVTSDLYAVTGTMTPSLPGLATVNVWGYTNTSGPALTKPGGPTLTFTEGQCVGITLHNDLTGPAAMNTALLFQGQDMIPDLTGATTGGTHSYIFTASRPGTYLYEAGLVPNAEHQVAMGLYGALIVRPAGFPLRAYDSADTAFDDEGVLVLSEIDPALNNRANPATFDMRKYAPRYFLINGKVHPSTDPIPATGGDEVLLRYVNAGSQYHSMAVQGAHQSVIALDGSKLDFSRRYVAETIGPGQTLDAIVTAPAATAAENRLAIYDGNLLLHNSSTAGSGGMLTFITVAGTGDTTDAIGPVTSDMVYTPGAPGTLTATVDDATTGGAAIQAAEYFTDAVGAEGTGTPGTGTGTSFSFEVPEITGEHILYVRGQDSLGNWGALNSVLVVGNDADGPITKDPTLTPSLTNGTSTTGVDVHATGDDTSTGGSNIIAAEYTIDAGAAESMTVNTAAPIASVDATIPPAVVNALAEGSHVVSIRSRDAALNWGSPVSVNLVVDKTGPITSGVSAAPQPNNGTVPFNSGTPAVRVTAPTLSDPMVAGVQSNISGAEAFIDTVGANGTGFGLTAGDGVFNSPLEAGYVDIPLATIKQLSNGNHTISVHARDAAGNWGTTTSTILLIDKIAPRVLSINRLDANPTTAASVSWLVTFSESVTGVTSGNFSLASGNGLTGAAITSVTGSGATRTVTASTGSGGGGTLGLNLASATGIKDAATNGLPATGLPFVGQVYMQPTPPLYLSTFGNSNPPGVAGTADDADIYFWNGATFSRSIDVTAITNPLPAGANVDGFDRSSATQFYLSLSGTTNVPGIGVVQDEDVILYNAGTWSLFFDGSINGVAGTDLDAISIVAGSLYFSTDDTDVPPGVSGAGDDADIYLWNGGSSYTRVSDASALGWSTANVDGLVWVDATHVYLSYSGNTTAPGIGAVQDEDVVRNNGGTWSVHFNGTAVGLTTDNLDVDAFDLP